MSNWFGLSTTANPHRSLGRRGWRTFTLATLGAWMAPWVSVSALAQVTFPACPPPQTNEYLLLVRGNTEAERNRVQDLLPSNSTVMVCNYLSDTVVRAGGFTSLENANAWAQYMTEVEGLQAFVARPAAATATNPPSTTSPPAISPPNPSTNPAVPPTSPSATNPSATNPSTPSTPTSTPPPSTTGTLTPIAYAPQPLNTGFAVLVDYQYQPETAQSIQRQIGQAVGLSVYRQRPYLLIAYSPNLEGAATTLQVLGGYGISGFIVDSREVVMLTPAVALSE